MNKNLGTNLQLVPLRIPTGWIVSFNVFYQQEPIIEGEVFKNSYAFSEDLLVLKQEELLGKIRPLFFIGLGWWLPERLDGHYRLRLSLSGQYKYLKTYESEHISEIQAAIDQWLHTLSAPFFNLSKIDNLVEKKLNKYPVIAWRAEESYQFLCTLDNIQKIQRRPTYNDIIINYGNKEIKIIEPKKGKTIEDLVFPSQFRAKATTITQWCLRADGQAMVVFDGNNQQACWLALDGSRQSYDLLNYPKWHKTTELRYLWKDTLWIENGDSYGTYTLNWNDGPSFSYISNLKARKANPIWSRIKNKIPRIDCQIFRVESDRARMLYHCTRQGDSQVGLIQFINNLIDVKFNKNSIVLQLAAADDQIFVMQSGQVTRFDKTGLPLEIWYPPKEFVFVDLDVLEDEQMLILACQSKSLPGNSQLLSYKLV